jgi:hypothetical protein
MSHLFAGALNFQTKGSTVGDTNYVSARFINILDGAVPYRLYRLDVYFLYRDNVVSIAGHGLATA